MPALLVSFLQQAVTSTGAIAGPLSAYLPEDLVGQTVAPAVIIIFIPICVISSCSNVQVMGIKVMITKKKLSC